MKFEGIELSFGYPLAVQVHNIPTKRVVMEGKQKRYEKEPLRSLAPLRICHNIETAIEEYVDATHVNYGVPAEVTLFLMETTKADDGVNEVKNRILAKYTVIPPKKVNNTENKEDED